jgi:flagellin
MSTGKKINAGRDNPAGLIALKALDAEYTATTAAIDNNQRTNAMLGKADGDLTQVGDLLSSIETLVSNSVGDQISNSEKAANQAQIDSAIDSIDRIIRTSTFQGKSLLNGQLAIQASNTDGKVADIKLYSRNPNSDSTTLSVNVTAASSSAAFSTTNSATGAMTMTITGKLGSATIDISDTDDRAAEISKINAVKAQTGVSATAGASNGIKFASTSTGSDEFVTVDIISGGGSNGWVSTHVQNGADATVTVNGQAAAADGNKITFNTNGISGSFTLTSTGDAVTTSSISVTGGGATFQLGSESSTRATIGINSLFSNKLGKTGVGFLNELKSGGAEQLLGTGSDQLSIVKEAINQVAEARGRIGGFQKYQVQTSINSLQASQKGLADAKSVIEDVDYATETAELNRQNVLMQSAISLLGLANQQSSQVLSLLQ